MQLLKIPKQLAVVSSGPVAPQAETQKQQERTKSS